MSATAFLVARKGAEFELLEAGEDTAGLRKKFKQLSHDGKDDHSFDGLFYSDTRGAIRQKRFAGRKPEKMPIAKKDTTETKKAASKKSRKTKTEKK